MPGIRPTNPYNLTSSMLPASLPFRCCLALHLSAPHPTMLNPMLPVNSSITTNVPYSANLD